MELLLNQHITDLKESSTLWINSKVKELRAQGKDVIHFGFGQSPFPVHEKVTLELIKHSGEKDYLPTLGLYDLREKICEFYKRKFNYDFLPEYLLIGPGSKELLFQALFVLEGDVIIPAPSWVSYGPQVNTRGKHISRILTRKEDGYKLQAKDLEQVCTTLTSKQKMLIINSPNNPSGSVYNDQEIQAIVEVCKKNNIVIFSDEIYGQIDWSGDKKKGFFHYYPERTIVTAGLSKSHSAGGYRLGFLATSPQMSLLIKALASLVSETFSAVSAPIQYAAVKAYSDDQEIDEYIEKCSQIHKACGLYLYDRMTKMGLELPRPDGAFYLMPSFSKFRDHLEKKYGIKNSIDLAKILLEKFNVATLPGCDFYCPPEWLNLRIATVDYDGTDVLEAFENLGKLDHDFVEKFCPNLKEGCDRIQELLA